ncbi:MAG: peptidylprolyl isomerase [Proteobacteria bacterium]|nr:peptidylprolyl isomerase [Pseudomonadota bacterium]
MVSRTAFAALLLLLLPLCASAGVVDRGVAVVNNDVITLSEMNDFGKPLFKKIMDETPAGQREAAMQQARLTVLHKLIEKKLILQEAKKYNIQISDQEVEGAFQRILAANKTTVDQFRKDIAAEGMSEKQYREELREQILNSKLVNHEVRTKVVISDSAVLDYYNSHYVTVAGGEYDLLQIGCTWGTATKNGAIPSQEEARQKIEKVRDLAAKGKDFKALAREYSDLPSAAEGGDLGRFQQDELAPFIRNAVVHLKAGEISKIVESGNAYHLFKLLSSQQGQAAAREPLDEVKEQIREKLYQQALEQRFKDWLTSIQERAYIKIF